MTANKILRSQLSKSRTFSRDLAGKVTTLRDRVNIVKRDAGIIVHDLRRKNRIKDKQHASLEATLSKVQSKSVEFQNLADKAQNELQLMRDSCKQELLMQFKSEITSIQKKILQLRESESTWIQRRSFAKDSWIRLRSRAAMNHTKQELMEKIKTLRLKLKEKTDNSKVNQLREKIAELTTICQSFDLEIDMLEEKLNAEKQFRGPEWL